MIKDVGYELAKKNDKWRYGVLLLGELLPEKPRYRRAERNRKQAMKR